MILKIAIAVLAASAATTFAGELTAQEVVDQAFATVDQNFRECSYHFTWHSRKAGEPDKLEQKGWVKIGPKGTRLHLERHIIGVMGDGRREPEVIEQEYIIKPDSFTHRDSISNPVVSYLYTNGIEPKRAATLKAELDSTPYDLRDIIAGSGDRVMNSKPRPDRDWEIGSASPSEIILNYLVVTKRNRSKIFEYRLDPKNGLHVTHFTAFAQDEKGNPVQFHSKSEYFENSVRPKHVEADSGFLDGKTYIWNFSNWSDRGPTDEEISIPAIINYRQPTVFYTDAEGKMSPFHVKDGVLVPDVEIDMKPYENEIIRRKSQPISAPSTQGSPITEDSFIDLKGIVAVVVIVVLAAVGIVLAKVSSLRSKRVA